MTWTLVTGASGFVGSYLMQELQKQGIQVKGVSRTNKIGLLQVPTYGPEMDWAPLLGDVDTIIHLAARVHLTKDRARDPLSEFRKANLEATMHLARAAAQAGVRRFIFVSRSRSTAKQRKLLDHSEQTILLRLKAHMQYRKQKRKLLCSTWGHAQVWKSWSSDLR